MPPGQQIAFEPALAQVLAQHLHHAAVRRDVIVVGRMSRGGDAIGHLEQRVQPVRCGLVRTEDAEVARRVVQLHHVAQEAADDARRFGLDLRRASAPRPRSRENRACSDPAAAARRWRADWRPCADRLSAPARRVPGAAGRSHRTAPRAGSSSSSLRACADARAWCAPRRAAPDARGTCPRPACRRRSSGRSSPSACARRSSATRALGEAVACARRSWIA